MDIERALRVLEERADEAEVFQVQRSSATLEVKKEDLDLVKESVHSGYGIRVIRDKREGFAYSNTLSEEVLEAALKAARVAGEDPHVGLPGPTEFKAVPGCYDRKLAALGADEAADYIRDLVEPCRDLGALPTTSGISWSRNQVTVANSYGLFGTEEETSIYAHLTAIARDEETHTGFHYEASRNLDLDLRGIGEEAARLALGSLGAERIGTRTLDVTLRPYAVAELLEGALVPSFSADNVQRGRSLLAGRVGEGIFSQDLSITDHGNLEAGLMSSSFDGEGTPTRKTPLVEKGVLKGFLYDWYTARKDGTESTGNADRPSHSSPLRIQASNFVIEGKGGLEEGGLVVHGLIGAHTSNPVTGEFSLETRNAFLEGKPVKKAIITGNIFELMNRIKGFGDDHRQVSSVRTPSVQFTEVRVVG